MRWGGVVTHTHQAGSVLPTLPKPLSTTSLDTPRFFLRDFLLHVNAESRCRLSASPATGLVGMKENGFLSDFFSCVGFLPLTTQRCEGGVRANNVSHRRTYIGRRKRCTLGGLV